jgi:hypothetical protein
MQTVKITTEIKEPASRVELLVRFVYWIPLFILLIIYCIPAFIAMLLQFWVILFTGKRSVTLGKWARGLIVYQAKVHMYLEAVTDERPELSLDDLN